ncbi:hypothetical protein VE03_04399 [Pseudogymnoascus sp. 23342-1-I1]|nr:hypothetical protein VE03_04399 [Pseudogymnoascus sp. 23342-1-I1]
MDHRPLYTVTEFWTHYATKKSDITVMCNGTCFHLSLSAENFQEAPEIKEQYLQYLAALEADDPDITEEDLYDWALEPLLPLFQQIDSNPTNKQTFTLYDYFNPITLKYKLHAAGGILLASPNDETNATPRRQGVNLAPSNLSFQWPLFRPSDISICNKDPKDALTQFPRKVFVDKEICYFKAFQPGCQRDALHELNAYLRIDHLKIEDSLRVPHIVGIVQGEDSSSYVGLLLSFIDCDGRTLEGAVRADTPEHLRQRWVAQVTSTVNHLHEAGIVWGDAKAANVLVDINMDAWIIDFGGGFTEGWVEREKAGTVGGDIQGLAKIVDYVLARTKH